MCELCEICVFLMSNNDIYVRENSLKTIFKKKLIFGRGLEGEGGFTWSGQNLFVNHPNLLFNHKRCSINALGL